jgi:hypothetical protein
MLTVPNVCDILKYYNYELFLSVINSLEIYIMCCVAFVKMLVFRLRLGAALFKCMLDESSDGRLKYH